MIKALPFHKTLENLPTPKLFSVVDSLPAVEKLLFSFPLVPVESVAGALADLFSDEGPDAQGNWTRFALEARVEGLQACRPGLEYVTPSDTDPAELLTLAWACAADLLEVALENLCGGRDSTLQIDAQVTDRAKAVLHTVASILPPGPQREKVLTAGRAMDDADSPASQIRSLIHLFNLISGRSSSAEPATPEALVRCGQET